MRWVTSRMNSGTSLRLTRELLLCCCEQEGKHQNENPFSVDMLTSLKKQKRAGFCSLLWQSFGAFCSVAAALWRHLQPQCDGCRTLHTTVSSSLHFHQKTEKKTAITDRIYICVYVYLYVYVGICILHQPAEAEHLQSDGWGNFGGSLVGLQPVCSPAGLQKGFCEIAAGDPGKGRLWPRSPSQAAAPPACLSWTPRTWQSGSGCGAALSASALYGDSDCGHVYWCRWLW